VSDRSERAKTSITTVIHRYMLTVNTFVPEELAGRIYEQAGRDIYEGWASGMREAR
jgi:hypothetical protein